MRFLINDILIPIILSMLSAYVFWVLTFVVTYTKVVFSDTIEKSIFEKAEDGSPIFRVRVMNIGRRDLMEVVYTAKLRIRNNGKMRTTYLCLGDDQTIPVLKGRNKKTRRKCL